MQLSHSEQQESEESKEVVHRGYTHSTVQTQSSGLHSRTSSFGGMPALSGGAVCVCADGLPIHTGAAGTRTLRVPLRAVLIFQPLEHTRYSDTRGVAMF